MSAPNPLTVVSKLRETPHNPAHASLNNADPKSPVAFCIIWGHLQPIKIQTERHVPGHVYQILSITTPKSTLPGAAHMVPRILSPKTHLQNRVPKGMDVVLKPRHDIRAVMHRGRAVGEGSRDGSGAAVVDKKEIAVEVRWCMALSVCDIPWRGILVGWFCSRSGRRWFGWMRKLVCIEVQKALKITYYGT